MTLLATPKPITAIPGLRPPIEPGEVGGLRERVPTAGPLFVHGTVWRGRVPLAGRKVTIRASGTSRTRSTPTDGAGAYRFAVEAGSHVLEVPLFVGEIVAVPSTTRRVTEVAAAPGGARGIVRVQDDAVRHDLRVGTGTIVAVALDARSSRGIAGCWIALRHWHSFDVVLQSNNRGVASFEDLGFGKYVITGRLRGYRSVSEIVEITAANPSPSQLLNLEPTCSVDVRLVDDLGQAMEISAATRLRVVHGLTGTSITPSNLDAFRGKTRPTALEFDDCKPGRYTVTLLDEMAGEPGGRTVRFQPAEASRLEMELLDPGHVTIVDLPVRYRAYVQLRAHNAGGGLADVQSRVDWHDPVHGSIRVEPARWQRGSQHRGSHFDGYLAPGTYSVTFRADAREHRESLRVARESIDRTYTLPW